MKTLILAGGKGTRLFPLSRKKYPKQFVKFPSQESLFQQTLKRSLKISSPEDIFILTNKDYLFLIKNQIEECCPNIWKILEKRIILEPVARNTAPAIALAIKYLMDVENINIEESLFITPSDHLLEPVDNFISLIEKAKTLATHDYLITFGIKPFRPDTGYGYIEVHNYKVNNIAFPVKKFHEKPNKTTAEMYLSKGTYYWNSGLFLFSINAILNEFKNHASEIYEKMVNTSYEEFLKQFINLPEISIDYAIMEKSNKLVMVPMENIKWYDLGSWDAYYEILPKDDKGNIFFNKENIISIESQNCFLYSEKLLCTIGLKDIIIINTDDVLLICKKGESQKVRDVLKILEQENRYKNLLENRTIVFRPWGAYKELERGDRYKIKKLIIKPGEALSLQLHHHRSEHWIVVKGTAKVVLEDEEGKLKEYYVHENESIFVPKSKKHRIINPGKLPLEIIEVQVGEYVEEDDIIRYDDIYNRI